MKKSTENFGNEGKTGNVKDGCGTGEHGSGKWRNQPGIV